MKKIFFSALAVLSLAACMQEAVVETPQGGAIAFDNAFVGNATRAAVIDNTNLNAFKVWGYVNAPKGTVFNGNVVSKSNETGTWEYTGGTQYWAPNNNYVFAAVAPVTLNWNLTMETTQESARTLTFENDGNTDLIYATKTVQSAGVGEKNDAVALEFKHLLSKVKLSFTNGFPTNATVALTNIEMQTPKNASIDLAASEPAWTTVDKKTFEFSDVTMNATASADVEEYFIVPAEAVITFDLAVSVGTEKVYTGSKSATLPTEAFEMGHAYNLSAEIDADALNFDEIVFTVEGVNDWVEAGNDSDKAANLLYAAQVGGEITLEEDVVLDAPVVVPAHVDLVINLNGKTIKNSTQSETFGEGEGIIAYGNLTINGEGTVEGSTMAVWARGTEGANVTINGGTYYGCAEGFAKGGRSVIYASSGNTIDIYGGTFQALAADKTSYANKTEGVYAAVNVADNNGTINVYGGTFVGQNPAAPGTEPAAWNAAHPNGFVAEGYISRANGTEYNVVPGALVSNKEDLLNVMENTTINPIYFGANIDMGTSSLLLTRDLNIDMDGMLYKAYSGNGVGSYSFNLNNHHLTVNNANMETEGFYVTFDSKVTFNGGDVVYKSSKNSRNLFYVASNDDRTAVVEINGGNFSINTTHQPRVRYVAAEGNAIIVINDGNFANRGESGYEPITATAKWGYTPQVIIKGGTFAWDPSAYVAEGYVATKNGSKWTVSKQ